MSSAGHVHSLLLELREDGADVLTVTETYHDVEFLQLHIDGVVVLDEKDLDLLLQYVRPAEEGKKE